ncbi:cytochrome P450 [Pseudomonas sp. LD120]|uniref:cytochrome P450 n=1 Tax=Pseudomonas sp. LD120 TaxID=485751 RepID=UPI00135AE2E9|nr:cytochrome P450 [Pseudomonas sp. LD120]KAF0864579.1 cytochrome P450 [Pseudomonas sp. LD120]
MDPISAATHFNPYDVHYPRLRARGGLTFDATLGLWVASSATAVAAVLNHPACRVRPLHEPVPRAIVRRPAGQLFARLMRMNDGPRHRCPRAAIEAGLGQLVASDLMPTLANWRPALVAPLRAADLRRWQFALPVALVAGLLGVPTEQREDLARRTGEWVACFSPLSNESQLLAADQATQHLSAQLQAVLAAPEHSPLLSDILRRSGDLDPQDLLANLVGLLAQTHDACAGLIGNSLIALLADPALCQHLRQTPAALAPWLLQRQRLDPPVQNTRRFVAEPCTLNGIELQAGDCVLVLLAAANHDPALAAVTGAAATPPDFSFGAGVHRCPGQGLAQNIVGALLQALLRTSDLSRLPLRWCYQPSVNGRIPLFEDSLEAGQ